MLRIPCPFCGPRDETEFLYGGDATAQRPALESDDVEAWFAYVYLRDNPRGAHREFWQHVRGCRQWLVVSRDTLSQEITKTTPARDAAKEVGR